MKKKKLVNLLGLVTILVHNDLINEVMNQEEADRLMEVIKEKFKNDEQNALDYIKEIVKESKAELDEYYKTLKGDV